MPLEAPEDKDEEEVEREWDRRDEDGDDGAESEMEGTGEWSAGGGDAGGGRILRNRPTAGSPSESPSRELL